MNRRQPTWRKLPDGSVLWQRPSEKPTEPPRIPREDDVAPPWALVIAGCILGALTICTVVGAVQIVRWLHGI